MAYRYGDRYQMMMLPPSIEDYVATNDPVRAYDAIVGALDFEEMGIGMDPCRVGNAAYDPRAMMKLLVYGYSYGVKSSRKLERECYHNIAFMWLMGGLKPDHKTIAEFRRRNKKALKEVLRQCVRVCIKLDLIAGNILFVDGTKIRANAGRHRSHDKCYYEKLLSEIDRGIEDLVDECEAIDEKERGLGSYVAMKEKMAKAQNLKDEIKNVLDTFEATGRGLVNRTDTDCAIMKSVQGSHASYNVQNVVDDKHGLIVHAEAVSETSDVNQFAVQIGKANDLLDEPCKAACGDAGYADTEELAKVDAQGIKVIVPSQRQAAKKQESLYSKSHFTYDKEKDCYFCPEGYRLELDGVDNKTGERHYQMPSGRTCWECAHYGKCTSAKEGRKVKRLPNEEIKRKLEAQYEEASSQEIYARRKSRVEHPFGHIKRNLKADAFMLRGREGAQAETSLLGTCFNVARMITILGVGTLIEKLALLRVLPAPA